MKVKSMKGFTLAELLIVMAIVVVLASVAIPTFTRQLETSRETADLETVRNAYTDAYAMALKDLSEDGKLDDKGDGSTAGTYKIEGLKFVQTTAGFDYITGNIGGLALTSNGIKDIDQTKANLTFTFVVSTADDTPTGAKKGDLALSAVAVGTAS